MKTGEQYKGKGTWGAVACNPKNEQSEESNEPSGDDMSTGALQTRILVLEGLWIEAGIQANGPDMNQARVTNGGSTDMSKMSEGGLKNYIEHLESLDLET